jgi:class 3 adenylate cyclase
MELEGHHLRLIALTQLGDFAAVDTEIAACDKLAGELRQPRYQWQAAVFRTMRALMQGRFKEAERLAQAALSIGQRGQQEVAGVVFAAHLFLTRWADGGLEELAAPGREMAERYGQAWPSAYVWLLTEIGRIEQARAAYAEIAAAGFDALRRNGDWLTSICTLSIASLAVGDRDGAGQLYELLAPYAERCTLFLAGAGCLGSNHAFLGLAAKAAGRRDDAISHFERALERNAQIGAAYIAPRVYYELASTLLESREPDVRTRATELIETGLAEARRIGMRPDAERLIRLRHEHEDRKRTLGWTALDSVAQSVEQDRPDLRPAAAPDGTVTIMFSDIEGSTVLTEQLGDQRWLELLHRHNALIRRHLAEHAGFEVKSQGDGFMVAFASARSAIQCAIAIQREVEARNEHTTNQRLRVRIGLHTGEVIREREDFFGKNVILAARIAAAAHGGEILVSALVRELVASTQEFDFGEPREERLKGLHDPHRL